MSCQAVRWALEQPLKASDGKFVLVALAEHADERGYCFPGQATLADATGQAERTVRAHLVKLEALGLIRREARHRDNGSRTSDGYHLIGWKAQAAPATPPANPAASTYRQPAKSASQPANNVGQPADFAGQPAEDAALEPSVEPPEEPSGGSARTRASSPPPPEVGNPRRPARTAEQVQAALMRLCADFARQYGDQAENWTHHSDAQLGALWEASHPRHWQGGERAGKRRSWNFLDLLNGEILPPSPARASPERASSSLRAELTARGLLPA